LKVFYSHRNILYKVTAVLTVIFTLFFGQAFINSFGKYISDEFFKIIIVYTVPLYDNQEDNLTYVLNKVLGFETSNPKSIIDNQPVMAGSIADDLKTTPEINVKERAVQASTVADYNTARGIEVKNSTDYSLDINKLINEELLFKVSKTKPSVLIVHTHTSEAYLPVETSDFVQSDPNRTQNQKYNVVRVGEEFKNALESKGIIAIHDKTVHDYPSYNGSYINTLKTIEKQLEKNPSIKIVVDIHRDAVEADGTVYKFSTEIENKRCAQVMIVTGSDANGIENPNWRENLKFALKFQRRMNLLYSGLTRPLSLVRERYNTHATTGSIILEVGTTGNTLEEAVNAAYYSGIALGDMLGYISE